MKLIASLTSPFVRKVRVVMAEKKLDFQMEIENVWAPDTKIQEIHHIPEPYPVPDIAERPAQDKPECYRYKKSRGPVFQNVIYY